MKTKHEIAMEIVKILMDSGLSINSQLKIIRDVRVRLDFCREEALKMKQQELEL